MPDVFSFSRVRSMDVRPKPDRRIYRLKGMFSGRVCAGETGHVFRAPASRTFVLKGKGGALHRFSRCIDNMVAVPRVRDFAAIYRGEGIGTGCVSGLGSGLRRRLIGRCVSGRKSIERPARNVSVGGPESCARTDSAEGIGPV